MKSTLTEEVAMQTITQVIEETDDSWKSNNQIYEDQFISNNNININEQICDVKSVSDEPIPKNLSRNGVYFRSGFIEEYFQEQAENWHNKSEKKFVYQYPKKTNAKIQTKTTDFVYTYPKYKDNSDVRLWLAESSKCIKCKRYFRHDECLIRPVKFNNGQFKSCILNEKIKLPQGTDYDTYYDKVVNEANKVSDPVKRKYKTVLHAANGYCHKCFKDINSCVIS